MKNFKLISYLAVVVLLILSDLSIGQTTITIGAGTSSSSTRGPFQRSDTNSSSVYSRNVLLFTAAELSAAGIVNGSSISELRWEKGNSNVIIGSGNANLKLYLRNSTATFIDTTDWALYVSGTTLVLDSNFNTTNNFPATSGWMGFPLDNSFTYTGGALEIAIDWDGSQVTSPQFNGNGSVTWRWAATSGNTLAQRVSGSAAPNDLTKVKAERVNTQIVYNASSCLAPTVLSVSASSTAASISWVSSTSATAYNWKVVDAGMGSSSTAISSGTTTNTTDAVTGLTPLTSYDLFVASDCGSGTTSAFAGPYTFLTRPLVEDTITIGAGTSSSSTRGPFQRSDTNSTTVFSRWHHIYTAAELASAGISSGALITELQWELASSNTIIGSGNASLKVYIKNSSATAATADTWVNLTNGSSLVVDNNYNINNNFPGANGWMPFSFNTPFSYTGGSIEISVDWDASQVSTPAFSGDGALKWRWESTAPDNFVVKKTSSSSASSTLSDLKNERANIKMVFEDNTVGLDELDNVSNYSVSPNPSNGVSILSLELKNKSNINITIYNVNGEIISDFKNVGVNKLTYPIELSNYENGVYFVRLMVNNSISTKKIILLK